MQDPSPWTQEMVESVWEPTEEGHSFQAFYEYIIGEVNTHYWFCHNGHEYFLTFDFDANHNQIYVIYDRDLKDPRFFGGCWENEPRSDYDKLEDLIFNYVLKNDGRTIAEYLCDFWGVQRPLFPEPLDEVAFKKYMISFPAAIKDYRP